jgi:NADH:ubiquinone oxidoreductase subunit K
LKRIAFVVAVELLVALALLLITFKQRRAPALANIPPSNMHIHQSNR